MPLKGTSPFAMPHISRHEPSRFAAEGHIVYTMYKFHMQEADRSPRVQDQPPCVTSNQLILLTSSMTGTFRGTGLGARRP